MKKIIVTGGAGFIGSHTVVELHEAGYLPVIIDNFSNSERFVLERLHALTKTELPFYELDCADEAAMRRVFEEEDVAGAVHFAAYKAVGESVQFPLKYYENNLNSLTVLLKLMREFAVPDLVFSSSCTVYGQPARLPVTEESPICLAESPYGFTKQICETIIDDCIGADAELKAVTLRYFNPIGAHPSSLIGELPLGTPENLVPFITQTAAGIREKLTVFGDDYCTTDGSCIRDYIHVVDLAKAHVKALDWLGQQPGTCFNETFNVGTGCGVSVLEAIRAFETTTGTNLEYEIGERRAGDVEQIYANVDKAKETLGWSAELSLNDAMRDAWNWQKTLGSDD